MNAGIGNQDTFTLRLVLTPCVVQFDGISQLFALEHRTVQRTDGLNINCCQLLHHRLYLGTILSTDIKIVATCLTSPIVSLINQCTEFAECISREDYFVQAVVTHDNLWPVYHRSSDKSKFMAA